VIWDVTNASYQSRSREPGFKSPLRISTDDLPRNETKTIELFHFSPFLPIGKKKNRKVSPEVKILETIDIFGSQ